MISITSDLSADLGGEQTQFSIVGTSANTGRPGFFDHTFGDTCGQYMAVNASAATSIYSRNGIAVSTNTNYTFSVFLSSWTNLGTGTCNLDVDGNGARQPFVDGIILVRRMLGVADVNLLNGITLPGTSPFTTAAQIRANVNAKCGTTF